ncbi:MAG: polysaccharide deacetylase family protein [Kofleriaceae bacterium]|nr:polysaccharide deacetylase family protein [Kofleriaceae bacterium]
MTSLRARIRDAVLDRVPGILRRGPVVANRVALTFDDGPDHMTPDYLDVLDELGVPATFFLVGARAEDHPRLVNEYRRRGHQIASHGYDHRRFTQLGHAELLDQCARTDDAIGGQLSGRSWVRPPHGSLDVRSMLSLLSARYTVALWTIDTLDHGERDADAIVARCVNGGVRAGDVLLFHEGQQWTLDALPRVVESIRAQGLECVTMHDLYAA